MHDNVGIEKTEQASILQKCLQGVKGTPHISHVVE